MGALGADGLGEGPGADVLDPLVPAGPGVSTPDVPLVAPSHVLASMRTDVTRSVAPAAVDPAAALALPVGDALLLCSMPVISTRLFRCFETSAVCPSNRYVVIPVPVVPTERRAASPVEAICALFSTKRCPA